MSTRLRFMAIVFCVAAIGLAGLVVAQGQPRARQRANAPGSRMREGNPEATRERMMQRMQQQLEASDAEWQVIQPKLEKVVELTRQASRRGSAAVAMRPGERRNPGQRTQRPDGQARQPRNRANREASAVEKASTELRELLTNTSASPEQIKAKLTALRHVRQTAQQNLAEARTELQQILTVKQEARLVLMGLLE